MISFQIKCADMIIEIRCLHDTIRDKCRKFLTESQKSDIIVSPKESHLKIAQNAMTDAQPDEIEFGALLCDLHEKLLEKNACCMHASVVSVDGVGYAFAAKSGVGKTTHANLWKKTLGNRCEIINGDKPILSFKDSGVYASGSPWCGKEGFSKNESVPLKGICFLERGEKNTIRKLSSDEIIDRLFYQLSIPAGNKALVFKCLGLANNLINTLPFYLLQCNISDEAARIAYEEMNK